MHLFALGAAGCCTCGAGNRSRIPDYVQKISQSVLPSSKREQKLKRGRLFPKGLFPGRTAPQEAAGAALWARSRRCGPFLLPAGGQSPPAGMPQQACGRSCHAFGCAGKRGAGGFGDPLLRRHSKRAGFCPARRHMGPLGSIYMTVRKSSGLPGACPEKASRGAAKRSA